MHNYVCDCIRSTSWQNNNKAPFTMTKPWGRPKGMTKTNKEKEDASKKRAASKKLTAQQQDLLCKHLILACTSKNASTNASNNVYNNASNNAATAATMIMQMEAEKMILKRRSNMN